jgi:hypothetical protein
MADQQDRPDEKPDEVSPATESAPTAPGADPVPPAVEPPPPPAKKAPAKAAKKAPAKAAKKVPAKAAKKAPAKKAVKKAPAKKAPPKAVPAAQQLADTNGDLATAAKEAAAQAKSTVASASNPVVGPAPVPLVGPEPSRLPIAAAIAAGVLAILVVLLARRHSGDD